MEKLSDESLINIIKAHRATAIGPDNKDVTKERAEALDRYHGRPYGNEEEGHSSVVTKDLSETAGWIIPAIMKVLLQSGNLAEFSPVGEEDVDQAERETLYVNHVIMKDNSGFMVIYDAVWDALILKNGYIKHYPEEKTKITKKKLGKVSEEEAVVAMINLAETHSDFDQNKVQMCIATGDTDSLETLLSDCGVEVEEQEELPNGLLNVKLKITEKVKREVLEATPPEELRVSASCRGSIKDANFVEHLPTKYRYELLEMGMDKGFVKDLPPKGGRINSSERVSRSSSTDEDETDSTLLDTAMDEMDYCEAYLRVDYDKDGIAELRKVITVSNKIPPGEDWNVEVDSIPFAGGVAKRIPHKHLGEGLNDDLEDLALIHTTLLRQALDNIYHTNHVQWVLNDRADEESFLSSAPGGLKHVNGNEPVNGCAEPVAIPPILNQILPAIDYVKSMREERTGINKTTTGLDPNILKQTTKGAFLENLNRASQKVEMMTRMIAETLVKETVLGVHKDLIEHQDVKRIVKLLGKYTPVKPDEWSERTDLTVNVGLGTGSGEEKIQKLTLLQGIQEKIMNMGLVGPEQAYSLFEDFAKALGAESPHKYIINPQDPKFAENKQYIMGLAQQGQQGNPLAEAEKIKGEFALQKTQIEVQMKGELEMYKRQSEMEKQSLKARYDAELQAMKTNLDDRARELDRISKENIEAMKAEVQLIVAGITKDLGRPGIGTL